MSPFLRWFVFGFLTLFIVGGSVLQAQEGRAWTTVFRADSLNLIEIDCSDSLNCLVVGRWGFGFGGIVWRTSDGGDTWEEVHRDSIRAVEEYTTVRYFGEGVGIASMTNVRNQDSGGFVRKTTDGGRSWEMTRIHSRKGGVPSVFNV